uniref:lysoplasmalogenase n=1 Tax=Hucho hucho TaxID=62062 RepID=A0A4W5P1L9_9TELE
DYCVTNWAAIASPFIHSLRFYVVFQVKSEGPKLVPFFKSTCVYFVLWLPTSSPSWFSALIKCLPIFCLWLFMLAHGFSFLGAHSSARKILAGLIFSSLGDAFLIWQEDGYFSHAATRNRLTVQHQHLKLDMDLDSRNSPEARGKVEREG